MSLFQRVKETNRTNTSCLTGSNTLDARLENIIQETDFVLIEEDRNRETARALLKTFVSHGITSKQKSLIVHSTSRADNFLPSPKIKENQKDISHTINPSYDLKKAWNLDETQSPYCSFVSSFGKTLDEIYLLVSDFLKEAEKGKETFRLVFDGFCDSSWPTFNPTENIRFMLKIVSLVRKSRNVILWVSSPFYLRISQEAIFKETDDLLHGTLSILSDHHFCFEQIEQLDNTADGLLWIKKLKNKHNAHLPYSLQTLSGRKLFFSIQRVFSVENIHLPPEGVASPTDKTDF